MKLNKQYPQSLEMIVQETAVSPHKPISIILFLPITLLATLFWFMHTQSASAAVDCANNTWQVGDEADLNGAIACFNGKTTAGDYSIIFTQNISLTASTTTITNNTANVTLLLEGADFTVDGQDTSGVRPFYINITTTVTIQNITIIGGNAFFGGGLYNGGTLSITNSTFNGNSAVYGAGIANGGTLTITNSTFSDNSANNDGGAIDNYATLTINNSSIHHNSSNTYGGGINHIYGTLILQNSTLHHNTSSIGGAISTYNGTLITITNSTISNNSVNNPWSGVGGGISNDRSTLTIQNSTINKNSANNEGGGIYNHGIITISNSIIANSDNGGDCVNNAGTIHNQGHNIVADNSCGFTGGNDPLLGFLQDNGGSTRTHALLVGSPAIDAGDTTVLTDQRGIPRPQGSADDIGAFEIMWFTLSVTKAGTGPGTVTSTPAALDCGDVCTAEFAETSNITLTATADKGYTFAGWSRADCNETAVCVLAVDEDKTVTATFNRVEYTIFLPFIRK